MNNSVRSDNDMKYMRLLAEKYPSARALTREIINLTAIRSLPKGTEHFMSDLHGEYEAFCHILNNCSGVIREKAEMIYRDKLSHDEIKEICTLIYYPAEKLAMAKKDNIADKEWYRAMLGRMIEIARVLSSKYTRSKVRKAMPEDYAYIIDELLHAQKDEDNNQVRYHEIIVDTVIGIDADSFVIALAELIKRLAVDRLHIVGDIYDRGESADKIMDLLIGHHSLDIEWGNHDILWMGAACGIDACIAAVVNNCIHYRTEQTLESGYGISLRKLMMFAESAYPEKPPMQAALLAIRVIQFKLEGQIIMRNPEFEMDDRLLLDKMDLDSGTVKIDGRIYKLNETYFPTLDMSDPYRLTDGEREAIDELRAAFMNSTALQRHIGFLYERGGMYKIYNGNLLYHGCVPLDDNGNLLGIEMFGEIWKGREFFDMAETIARRAYYGSSKAEKGMDFMWYLRCGKNSPLCGRNTKSFEHAFIDDKDAHSEEKNPYYKYYYDRETCEMILREFGLDPDTAHIINGHTPVRTVKGELPIRAEGKLLVIDGGFCKNYHETTGIAGYTLIYNSHGLRLKAHHPFRSIDAALRENIDIHSDSEIVETEQKRRMVEDTDIGKKLRQETDDLRLLLQMYRSGIMTPRE